MDKQVSFNGRAKMRKNRVFIALLGLIFLFSVAGCDVVDSIIDQIPGIVKKEVEKKAEEVKTEAEKAVEIEKEFAVCAVDPNNCPKITDPNINSPWLQVNAPLQNGANRRFSTYYLAVINQFDVENKYACRYRPGDGNPCGGDFTRCNIFAGDVMRAMGAPLPTKGEVGKGAAGSETTDRMTALAADILTWLKTGKQGWRQINLKKQEELNILLQHVQSGKPAVAVNSGHIAVLRPDALMTNLTSATTGDLAVAQAGGTNKNRMTLKEGFGGVNVEIFIHD
jgi:hypothetical protein